MSDESSGGCLRSSSPADTLVNLGEAFKDFLNLSEENGESKVADV